MLTMIHANPASVVDGVLRVDRKFHIGMQLNVRRIREPIVSVHPQGLAKSQIMDAVEVPVNQLEYGVLTVATDRAGLPLAHELETLRSQIARSRVMYGNALGSVPIARDLGIPYVMFVEYDLRTQITVAASEVPSLLRKAVRAVRCTLNFVLTQVPAMRNAYSVHCNGYPVFDEARLFSRSRLLYFDSRMSEDLVIGPEALAARLHGRHTRPLRLLYSGRYETMKGASHAVRVGLECMRLGLEFELHCYGQGTLEPEMKELVARANGQGRIFIHDAVPYPQLVELSRTFDIFVCCHIQADPSCTYLESFGSGLPIVGYDNRMWRRLSRESGVGFCSRMGDPASVAQDVRRLAVDSGLLAAMSHRARAFALSHCFEREYELRTTAINAALARATTRN